MLASVFGVSFLTPLDALFVLAAALPLAALFLTERRAARIRTLLAVVGPRRRALVPVVAALVALAALVAVAAAQPVVVRAQIVSERADAQAFVLFDTSLSMRASAGPGQAVAAAAREADGDPAAAVAAATCRSASPR